MRHWKPRLVLPIMLISLTGKPGFPQNEPPSADQGLRFQRLATLGRIWATIDHFHPFLAYRDIDWDSALLKAVPQATAARSEVEFAAAVQSMLSALEDGVTEVVTGRTENPASAPEPVRWSVRSGGVLVISINDYRVLRNYELARKQLYGLAEEIRRSRGVIFDLRPLISADFGDIAMRLSQNGIDQALCSKELRLPSQRRRTYSGLPNAGNSRWYYGSFSTEDAARVTPGRSGVAPRAAFIINSQSRLPPIALALQENGDARIVFDGAPSDAPAVQSREFVFAEGLRVRIRISELVYQDGTTGLSVDGRGEERDPVLVALGLLEQPNRPRPNRPKLPSQGLLVRKDYGGPEFPSGPERLLAAFRVWAVFEYFFPHRDIMGEDWDRALIDAIARMEKARDAIEYVDAISRMTSLTHDTHVTVRSKAVGDYFDSSLPIRLRFVEGRPVITQVATTAGTSAIRIGDSLLAIDGVDISALIGEARQRISSSTVQASVRYAMSRLTWAHGNETRRLSIQAANGEVREHTVATRSDYWDRQTSQPAGVAYRKLTPDIGSPAPRFS